MRRIFKSLMPKRQHSEITSDKMDIDMDLALRPGGQPRDLEGKDNRYIPDPENLMDDWLLSLRETKKQQDPSSGSRANKAWNIRRRLHPLKEEKDRSGSWSYSRTQAQRKWVDQTKAPLVKKASGMTLNDRTFPSEFGEVWISSIYRNYWLRDDTQGFLAELSRKYGAMLPEQKIWDVFACLVSELVPEDQMWIGAPEYVVANPNTIWQVGKCMLHILTQGRFWDEDLNALNEIDSGEKFGEYKQALQDPKGKYKYSKTLLKHVLGCLTIKEYERYTRTYLMDHFHKVKAVYEGTYTPPPAEITLEGPYTPKDKSIPTGLTEAEGLFYEGLIKIAQERNADPNKDGKARKPHVVTITDLAKDYDDLMAMMCLKELDRMGVIKIEGFVANLMPAEKRGLFGRGALDSLGLQNIEMGVGSIGDALRELNNYEHEFDNTDAFIAKDPSILPEGQKLLTDIFQAVLAKGRKLTVLTISSLMDIAEFSKDQPELLRKGVDKVVLQGGYRIVNDALLPDSAAANNRFDLKGADTFHKFMQKYKIPSTAWTKVAANATPIYSSLFEFLHNTGHPLGLYLRTVQTSQELNFYARCCSDHPFAPHMTQDWAVKTKSTWFATGHEPDEKYPEGEEMLPYFTKVIAYDALAVVGASGEDVLEKFGIVKPLVKRCDADHKLHKLVGVPQTKGTDEEPGLPEEENLDGKMMGVAISALMKGSILAYQQGLR